MFAVSTWIYRIISLFKFCGWLFFGYFCNMWVMSLGEWNVRNWLGSGFQIYIARYLDKSSVCLLCQTHQSRLKKLVPIPTNKTNSSSINTHFYTNIPTIKNVVTYRICGRNILFTSNYRRCQNDQIKIKILKNILQGVGDDIWRFPERLFYSIILYRIFRLVFWLINFLWFRDFSKKERFLGTLKL